MYGKDSKGNEDITVHYYESGDLESFINYNSIKENKNPYIIKTSTVGADGENNNIIKLSLSFTETLIEKIIVNIETDAEHMSQFYCSLLCNSEEISKINLSSGEQTLNVNTSVDTIIIYIESPKFYNNKQLNNYFKFNYCLPYTPDGEL